MPTFSPANLPPAPPDRTGWPWIAPVDQAGASAPPPGGWPRITIVCPSFQQGRFIEETIRSVVLQNYPSVEFIVMDAGSKDGTVGILERYAPWITFWESQPDRGQAHAINKGCDRATGEIIGWINSDDYYLPGAFATVARAYRSSPHRLLYGDWASRQNEDPELTFHRERPAFAFQVAVGGRQLPSHATFWPRHAHLRLNEDLQFTMDAELFKRLAASGLRPRHLPAALAVARLHPDSKTSRMIDVARAESAAWSRAQPWHTQWRWRLSRALDRLTRDWPR